MNKKKIQLILSLFLIALFPLTTTLTFQATGSQSGILFPNITTSGVGNFVEDFTTDVFKDPATTAWGWGTGTITNDRNFSWNILDHYYTESPVVDVEVQGRKAYLALYNTTTTSAISILNINNLSDIKLQGIENDPSFTLTKAIAVEGDILVAGQHHSAVDNSVVVLDVEDPFNPAWQWAYGLDNFITDIEIYGHIAFYTSYNDTNNRSLRFVDLEDPFSLSPFVKSAWDCNQSLGLDVVGGLAYIAASTEGFYVLNITNKFTPVEIGYIDTPGNATDVLIDGGFAYLADGPAGVHVIDIRDPSNPTLLSSYDTPGHARKLAKQGRTLYVADGYGGIQIFDVFNPHHISFVSAINSISYTYDVALFGGDLVVGTQNGVYSIRIGYIANFTNSWYPNPFKAPQVWDVRVVNDIAYIAAGEDGVYAVDVRNPLQPILLGNYTSGPGYDIRKIDINGKFLYAITYFGPFVFDISDPTDIKLVYYSFGVGFSDIFIHGEILYTSFTTGFTIWNASNNFAFTILKNFIPGDHENNTAIWVQGTHVYMVEGPTGSLNHEFSCYDVTDFTSPVLSDYKGRTATMYDVHVDGDLCYLGAGGWLSVYNVSDPTAMTYPGWETTSSMGVWSFGRFVVSAEMSNGIRLYDITDVTNPNLLSNYSAPSEAIQVQASGDYTYVANKSSLVILRHFYSAADTYITGTKIAQSTKISDDPRRLITNATLHKDDIEPFGTNVEYFMSADGGVHWELVIPGTIHTFVNPGYDLRWKAEITGPKDLSVHLYEITIDYEFNFAPTEPDLTDPGDTNFLGSVKLKWNESTDADGTIDHYDVEVSDSSSFTTIVKNYTTTKTSQGIYPLKPGTYYFRVRAVDDEGAVSDWSTADIEVTFNLLGPMWLGIIGGGLVVLIALIVIITVVVRRKKKVPTR